MKRSLFLILLAVASILWAVADLGTKHWVQLNLATPDHLLPIRVSKEFDNRPLCDVLTVTYGIKDCLEYDGFVLKVEGPLKVSPSAQLKTLLLSYQYLFAFNKGDTSSFAMRVPSVDPETGKPFDTLEEALKIGLGLSDSQVRLVLARGLYGTKRQWGPFKTSQLVHSGDILLLAKRRIVIIPNHLDLSYVENPAGAWGMLHSVPRKYRKWLFYIVTLLALGVVGYLVFHPPAYSVLSLIALSGILGGAIGNLVDRFSRGSVVDFIHMYWGRFHWPNYNVADIGITVGLTILLLYPMFQRHTPSVE